MSHNARAAADRLRAALDQHLSAVEARSGEHDPAVQLAYKELRAAAADYDLALYDEHDEVTPFDLPDPEPPVDDDDEEPSLDRLSLLARWDFSVTDDAVLFAAASRAVGEELDDPAIALAALVAAVGHTRLGTSASPESVGLRPHGHTTWVLATDDADPDDDDPSWMEDAFGGAEPELVLCRVEAPVEPDED
ncbi:hypothetical protein [Sporichthya sp.]|uniref:hypothetical protein n=1 Tax=Sporichthya sp. TaxID=65475 RepID=UPI00182E0F14|nr:hypothetical protein [Sporichthya sp.]MBA3743866.1 hypothetical protein [Sporichthya sp.]